MPTGSWGRTPAHTMQSMRRYKFGRTHLRAYAICLTSAGFGLGFCFRIRAFSAKGCFKFGQHARLLFFLSLYIPNALMHESGIIEMSIGMLKWPSHLFPFSFRGLVFLQHQSCLRVRTYVAQTTNDVQFDELCGILKAVPEMHSFS